jgi:S-adenosyl-L-methionine hydrolase (adenosine-forming)
MPDLRRIVTLLSDFGLRDHYVAAMKGVMLGINPDLVLVDISHAILPQDVFSGAFTLGQAYPVFPAGTIHLAVVDPGVGTGRRALAVRAGSQLFVAPDNGLLTHVLAREESWAAHEIAAEHYFRKPVSYTFHGRDIFAPVAAWLSRDVALHQLGPEVKDPVRLKLAPVTRVRDTLIQGTILAVDGFGNLVTNLRPEDLPAFAAPGGRACKVMAGQKEITRFCRTFGEGARGEVFIVPGSSGYLEIAMREGSAAAALGLSPGAMIGAVLS